MKCIPQLLCAGLVLAGNAGFSQARNGDPTLTEVHKPEAPVVTPGKLSSDAPSDAIVLFDGKDLSKWTGRKGGEVKW